MTLLGLDTKACNSKFNKTSKYCKYFENCISIAAKKLIITQIKLLKYAGLELFWLKKSIQHKEKNVKKIKKFVNSKNTYYLLNFLPKIVKFTDFLKPKISKFTNFYQFLPIFINFINFTNFYQFLPILTNFYQFYQFHHFLPFFTIFYQFLTIFNNF